MKYICTVSHKNWKIESIFPCRLGKGYHSSQQVPYGTIPMTYHIQCNYIRSKYTVQGMKKTMFIMPTQIRSMNSSSKQQDYYITGSTVGNLFTMIESLHYNFTKHHATLQLADTMYNALLAVRFFSLTTTE